MLMTVETPRFNLILLVGDGSDRLSDVLTQLRTDRQTGAAPPAVDRTADAR